jgi:hypothetical protein
MSRGSRVGYGREIGPRCRGPKSPANVELLQVIEGPLGQPGGPSTIFGSANLAPQSQWFAGVMGRGAEDAGQIVSFPFKTLFMNADIPVFPNARTSASTGCGHAP